MKRNKFQYKAEKLICIQNINTKEVKKRRKTTAEYICNNNPEWVIISKSIYKEITKKVIEPKPKRSTPFRATSPSISIEISPEHDNKRVIVVDEGKKKRKFIHKELKARNQRVNNIKKRDSKKKSNQSRKNKNLKQNASRYVDKVVYSKKPQKISQEDKLKREEWNKIRNQRYLNRIKQKEELIKSKVTQPSISRKKDPKKIYEEMQKRISKWRYEKMFMMLKSYYNFKKSKKDEKNNN